MKSTGNGDAAVCVNNLLRLFRGEVPYERVKGLDPRIVDRPILSAELQLRRDAQWLVEVYEPRAKIKSITVEQSDAAMGGFSVAADIEERRE